MTIRTALKNLAINGLGSSNCLHIDACFEQFMTGCKVQNTNIFISDDCKEGSFHSCEFENCIVYLHPKSVGKRAFVHCFFSNTCELIESDGKFNPLGGEMKTEQDIVPPTVEDIAFWVCFTIANVAFLYAGLIGGDC